MRDTNELQWDDIRFFVAACRAGSMAGGARVMAVEQSTMSRRIKRLEAALAVNLFERRTDGLRPTERAQALLGHAEAAQKSIEAMLEAAAAPTTGGVVRLATTETMAELLILPAMEDLLARHPDVRLQLLTGLSLHDVSDGTADVAIRNVRPKDDALVSRKVATIAFAPFAHRDYLTRLRPAAPGTSRLASLEWVTVAAPPGVTFPEAVWFAEHVGVEPRLVTNTFKAQLDAVRRGLGAGLIARPAASPFAELEEITVDVPTLASFDLWLVTHRDRRQLPHVRAVIEWLVALCRQLTELSAGSAGEP